MELNTNMFAFWKAPSTGTKGKADNKIQQQEENSSDKWI